MKEKFDEKKDRYTERTQNKRALKLKKLKAQKQAGFTGQQLLNIMREDMEIKLPKKGVDEGIISGIKPIKDGKLFEILDPKSKDLIAALLDPNILQELGEQIVIGDTVMYIKKSEQYFLLKRNPRKNTVSRLKGDSARFSFGKKMEQIIAANIDLGIIVASSKNPDFHSNFVDRYNILLQYGGVKPLICITKSDLEKLNDPILIRYKEKLGVPVVYCSTSTGEGIDELKSYIQGKKVVLVGNSGVGKSSLINYIEGRNDIKTQFVSDKTGQGKHTTTSSALYEWAHGSYIIDTPGIRSLELLEIERNDLKNYFPEFDLFSNICKFSDCSHSHEPICGVKKAVSTGELSQERYNNYLRIFNGLV